MAVGKIDRIDKYEILEQIGSGGMGAVYKALHPQFKKYVAIKEIRSELASNPDIQRRFEREAELLAQLPPHPNIVTVRDALVWRERLYLVIDYIDGGTLKDVVNEGGVSAQRAAAILDQLLSGLEAIHSRGITHRDLKSSNILIDREGAAFISDFGIAESVTAPAMSKPMATPRYAAPEIIDPSLGRFGTEYQADIYAAGFVAYEMLLGEVGFRESFPEVYNKAPGGESERWLNWHTDLTRSASNLNDIDPQIPRPLAAIVEQMMAKNVKERYQSASKARQDLAAWMWGDGGQARGRRKDSPQDDATLPVDRLRLGGGTARPTGKLRPPLTRDRSAYVEPAQAEERESPSPQLPPANRIAHRQRWWLVAGAALFLTVALVLLSALGGQPGFTLVVRGAGRGSVVYVDSKRVGVPTTENTIKVFGLRAGVPLAVRVFYEGAECQLTQSTVTGADGKLQYVDAQCKPSDLTLPDEINCNGQMVLIRDEGPFIMGNNNGLDDEKPEHQARLSDYYIDKYEVTNEQYLKFCTQTGHSRPTNPDPSYIEKLPKFPVLGVSWDDAKAYAEWTGKRLPTEEEWEKAASWDPKAKKKNQWPWGDAFEQARANLGPAQQPKPVYDYNNGASAYKVYNLAGNAAEWVDGYYQPYSGNNTPNELFGTSYRVVRGGGFRSEASDTRVTRRAHFLPDPRTAEKPWTAIGFRCAIPSNDPRLQKCLREQGLNR